MSHDIRFNHNLVPGKRNPDNSMDWHELGKFAVVNQGDELCTLLDPIEGEYGVGIFKHPIKPRAAEPYDLEVGKGISVTPCKAGKRLSAKLKGVLTLKHDDQRTLYALDVEERIKARSICVRTGN